MTRLIHFANYPNLHAGSFIPMLTAIMDAAIERGWVAEACFTDIVEGNDWQAELEERGVEVTMIPPRSRRELADPVSRIVDASPDPAVIHTHFTTYDLPAASAAVRRPDCALFWHIHTVLGEGPLSFARNFAKFAPARRRVDGIFVPAANIGEGIIRRGAPRDRVVVLPSPIDASAFPPPTEEARARARAEFGVPDGARVLLHIGRAWELKGGDVFLAAARRLLDEGRDVVAVSLRGGEPGERDADRLGLGDSVRIPGRIDEIRDLYAAADCFVAPSRGEGMPFSLVEALASGVPVVASDHLPGHRLLAEHIDACLLAPLDPESFAAAIGALLDRAPEVRRHQAEQGRRWIESNLDLDTAAQRLLAAYEGALARRA